MFIFYYRLSTRLLLVMLGCVGAWVGIQRVGQAPFPEILYSDTSNRQLYSTSIGCDSLLIACARHSRILLDGLYSLPVADWSPDGRTIAVHMNEGWLLYPRDCLLVLQTCQPSHFEAALPNIRIAWGPDGSTIASYATAKNATTTIETRGCWEGNSLCLQKRVILSELSLLKDPTWSADGSRMAFADYTQSGLVWMDTQCFDKAEGCADDLQLLAVGANPISWPSLSADGRSALLMMDTRNSDTDQQLFIVELDTGAVQQITFRAGTATFPDWSADERYVLFSGFEKANSGDLQLYVMDLARHISLPIVHHSGRDVAFGNWGTR